MDECELILDFEELEGTSRTISKLLGFFEIRILDDKWL
jgi:hypothetical protein